MNLKMVFNVLGRAAVIAGAVLILPALVSIIYKETDAFIFLGVAAASVLVGILISLICRTKNQVIYAKEGFAVVTFVWILMAVVGSLPFYISGAIPNYVDALFETVSGFTTTGASVVTNLDNLGKGMLFFRSFTHWLGGMGVLVFVMAIVPNVSDRSIHILRAEVPGPSVGKLVPRIKDTAKILYFIYIGITVIEIIFLVCGEMDLFESAVHAFGTVGTGGFGIKSDSIASYSAYSQWVITIFMFLCGMNFNLFYLILLGRLKTVFKSSELWVYIGLSAASIGIIFANVLSVYKNFSDTFRIAAFQVGAIVTTTGYSTVDFNSWPMLSRFIILLLMFTGGCAGSTAGGLKLARIMLIFKSISREFKKMLHPRSVSTVKLEGKQVEESTVSGVTIYFALYFVCLLAVFFLLCFESSERFSFETNFTAALTCINNVGPGFAGVGPAESFADYSAFSKLVLSAAMLLGRLEIFPILLAFSPKTWGKK